MDRNVLIGTVLIAVIMFVWLWLMAPPPPTDPGTTKDPTAEAPAPASPSEDGLQEETDRRELAPVTDSLLAGAATGNERLVTVVTDLYTATFSTKGATPVSFVLHEYTQFDQETPVQLIDENAQGALSLTFTTPTNHNVDSRSLFFETPFVGDTLVVGDQAATLAFTADLGQGQIELAYAFEPESYEVALQVAQENAASFRTQEGYELSWNGGIPFTEGDAENEAQSTGAFARSGGEVESITLTEEAYEEQRLSGDVSWVAVKNKFFTAVIMPTGTTRGAELIGEKIGEVGAPEFWEDYTATLLLPATADADSFRLYVGPMEFYRITDYRVGLYDMVDYGWDFFEWITRPLARFIFIPMFAFLGGMLPNYGLVIIVFAVVIKFLLYPLTKKSYESMARMKELQPKMEAIKEKYGDNPQKQQEAMMKMYKETGINPLGGCMPMLLQYPIIIALWQYLPQSLELRQASFLWAPDLSAPDVILELPFTIPLYGDFVAGFTLLMGLSLVVQMRLQMNPSTNPQAKIFTYVMPVMIFAIFNRLAAGLSLYYLVYNIVTALQQVYINKRIEQKQEEPGSNGKAPRRGTPRAEKKSRSIRSK